MLVLTRKLQEKIRIGDQVTITVLRMKGKAVRLGIEAPAKVAVIRGELLHEQTAAVEGSTPADMASGAMPVLCDTAVGSGSDPIQNRTEPAWARDTHPRLPLRRNGCDEPQSEVRFARVPREKAAQFLDHTAPGAGGPLRSMLDERSKAV